MTRIILPLAVIATLLFAPIFSETVTGSFTGDSELSRTGQYYVGNTLNCFLEQNFSIADECAPQGGNLGLAIFGAIFVSGVAAILGILGLLPFIGRLVSFITTVAGIVVIAAIGFFCLNIMSSDQAGVEWGSYIAGSGGLLTLISGLSGMRGR